MSVGVGNKPLSDELYFSLPQGKLPFIGIIHARIDVHILKKEFLIEHEKKEIFISFGRDCANIRLQLSNRDTVQFHSQLKYNRPDFLVWLDCVKNSEVINFGHLQKKDGRSEVIKHPNTQQKFYFPIKNLFILDLKDKAAVRVIR